MSRRPGLFDPCPCGSGKRFHSCCKPLGAAAGDPVKLVALAVRRHAAGDLAAAEDLYRKALQLDGANVDALRNLALLLADRQRFEEAEGLLRRCLDLDPLASAAHFALGTVLARQQHIEAAAEAFRAAHDADPSNAYALVNLAAVLVQLGRRERAMEALEAALHIDPRNPDAALNLALLKSEVGQHQAALDLASRAASVPGRPQLRAVEGSIALRAGAPERALQAFQAVLAARPDDFDARVNTGSCLADLGRTREAIPHFEHALRLQPQSASVWCNLALARLESGQPLAAFRDAVARAAQHGPAEPIVLGHQGLLAALSGDLEEALRFYGDALRGDPANVYYCVGLASVLYEQGGPASAARAYQEFLRSGNAASTTAHFELALLLLQVGRFAEAWPHYDFRNQTDFRRRRGESLPPLQALHGRRLVVRYEQGLGDQLFLLRFIPAMRALVQAPQVAYASKAELLSLVQRAPGLDSVTVSQGAQDEPGLLLGDLPGYVMAQAPDEVPPPLALSATADARARARQLLEEAGPGPYLAATWEAGTAPWTERERRLALLKLYKRIDPHALGTALAGWPGTVLSLQRAPQAADQAAFDAGLGRKAVDLSALNQDLETMLAVLELVDEYVGVSNTNMHLRAATGRPARVLVPRPYEWRWMYEGSTSPWFPGFRVYRETREARWAPALGEVARDLAQRD
ncbi:MAG TPA: tetratricopeptide repeat protein [Burkholderiales bacterium]|nr:tetratricopeptide repeat protein [Burkholderiales bacterium]